MAAARGMTVVLLFGLVLVARIAAAQRQTSDEYDTSGIVNGGDDSYLHAFPNPGLDSAEYGIVNEDLMLNTRELKASECSLVLHKLIYADMLARMCRSFSPAEFECNTFILTAVLATSRVSEQHACIESEMLHSFLDGLLLARSRAIMKANASAPGL
ncbi:hypothetical protein FVE85_0406 [Porphyridium purpureum]|uniref:Uncharacterized protein n=1 Tax=Porphyridium purpureum TaxID=35688 RepID=A0A5J4Z1W8_PORPP|nr:hypothetical protein FVE85_0406 [Porphyridium purpureum]|eukprot:POR0109..scf208_2